MQLVFTLFYRARIGDWKLNFTAFQLGVNKKRNVSTFFNIPSNPPVQSDRNEKWLLWTSMEHASDLLPFHDFPRVPIQSYNDRASFLICLPIFLKFAEPSFHRFCRLRVSAVVEDLDSDSQNQPTAHRIKRQYQIMRLCRLSPSALFPYMACNIALCTFTNSTYVIETRSDICGAQCGDPWTKIHF